MFTFPSQSSSFTLLPLRLKTHLILLLQVGDHHYDWAFLLPHHPPEVPHRVHSGTLCGDVGLLLAAVALQTGET